MVEGRSRHLAPWTKTMHVCLRRSPRPPRTHQSQRTSHPPTRPLANGSADNSERRRRPKSTPLTAQKGNPSGHAYLPEAPSEVDLNEKDDAARPKRRLLSVNHKHVRTRSDQKADPARMSANSGRCARPPPTKLGLEASCFPQLLVVVV